MKKLILLLVASSLLFSCTPSEPAYTAKSVQSENPISKDWQISITKIDYTTYIGQTDKVLTIQTQDEVQYNITVKWDSLNQTLLMYSGTEAEGHNLCLNGKVIDGKLVDTETNPGYISIYDFSEIQNNKLIQTFSIVDPLDKAGIKNNTMAVFY